MNNGSVLVAFPGNPLNLSVLRPNVRLASLAGALERAGHPVTILDYGCVETLDRLYSSLFRRSASRVSGAVLAGLGPQPLATLGALWELRGMRRSLRAEMGRLLADAARMITTMAHTGFVFFYLAGPDDLPAALHIAKRVRGALAGVQLVATGPLVEWAEPGEPALCRHFDHLLSADAEFDAIRVVENRTLAPFSIRDEAWLLDGVSCPVYHADAYPALESQTKLELYEIECSRDRLQASYDDPQGPSRARSACAVGDEVQYLVENYGARAFCLTGRNTPFCHMDEVAQELQGRQLGVRYCRTGMLHTPKGASFAAPVFNRMKASGCRAVDFEIDTGSQWMLDDYYKRDFGITEAEQVLRACKCAGLFTVERFLYPAPADDYHSRAETARLIERTLPDAARIEIPWALPPAFYEAKGYSRAAHRAAWFDKTLRKRADWPSLDSAPRWASSQTTREHASLIREIEALHVNTSLTADAALVARISGYEGREQDFGMLMLRHFFAGDAASIAALVERFNERMEAFGRTEARKGARPLLAAVGN